MGLGYIHGVHGVSKNPLLVDMEDMGTFFFSLFLCFCGHLDFSSCVFADFWGKRDLWAVHGDMDYHDMI